MALAVRPAVASRAAGKVNLRSGSAAACRVVRLTGVGGARHEGRHVLEPDLAPLADGGPRLVVHRPEHVAAGLGLEERVGPEVGAGDHRIQAYRHPPVPADQVARQAGRAHRRRLPPDRRAHEQLHQQRHQQDLHPDPVQLDLPEPPPGSRLQHGQRRALRRRRLCGGAGGHPDAHRQGVVPGHRRRRGPVQLAAGGHQEPRHRGRAHPVGRPPVPHGLHEVRELPPRDQRRHHHRLHRLRLGPRQGVRPDEDRREAPRDVVRGEAQDPGGAGRHEGGHHRAGPDPRGGC
uniref:Glucose-1-phosphate adenylyltransferase n=1 Tax=Chlamydomonas reinhardtii TaxID=3055 RepID=Q42702_CHLRE|nr:glucose-1-phosphate adenylyltransferase [Chlamydomonas reinhardtii]